MRGCLLVGPGSTLPGETSDVRGAEYRVTSAPVPMLTEAWLPAPVASDQAFGRLLESAIDGETFRIGEQLATFGVRWIVVTGESPLEAIFSRQLDLLPLEGLRRPTFIVDNPAAARAATSDGEAWHRTPRGYEGEPAPGERLRIAESADARWGSGDWEQVTWANEVDAGSGEARFEPISSRRIQAQLVAAGMAMLFGIAWWGRRG